MRSITAIALCLLAQSVFAADCENGTSNACPEVNSKCFASDAGKSRASTVVGTQGYLECSSDCIWTSKTCPEGKYYTERLQDCVPPEDADSGAALFGCRAQKNIFSLKTNLGITECKTVGCPNSGNVSADWRVLGSRTFDGSRNAFIVTRHPNSDYYTFEFKPILNARKLHVLTESGTEVWSKLFKEDPSPDNMVWRVVPTTKSFQGREMYWLVSPATGRALTVKNVIFGTLEMHELLEIDRQFWIFVHTLLIP